MSSPVYVGIDAAKLELEVCIGRSKTFSIPNTISGITTLIKRLERKDIAWVVIESTGIYSRLTCELLHQAGFRVALVQPGRIKQFAKSQGQHAKTDRIDAGVIARYGEATQGLIAYEPPSPTIQRLRALVDRRDQILDDRIREENRLEACLDADMRKDLKKRINELNKRMKKLEDTIIELVKSDTEVSAQVQCLEVQKGIGRMTAICMLVHLPELGLLNRQAVAALGGLAPFNNDSGPRVGKRTIYGGRARVRKALYMASLSAIIHDPYLKVCYTKLRKRGKAFKVAITAVMRKILVRLNSLMKHFLNPEDPNALNPDTAAA